MENSKKDWLTTAGKAFCIGAGMLVPGVSGGSLAMALGVYDRLISAIPGIFSKKTFRKSFFFLAVFALFGLLGVFAASRQLNYLIDLYEPYVMFFIIGSIIGSIPMILKKAHFEKATAPSQLVCILAGVLVVFAISLLPEGLVSISLHSGFSGILLQFICGLAISSGFVLPGISITYLLVVLGLYSSVIDCIFDLDVLPLIPLASGMIIGAVLFAYFLKWAMEKKPKISFAIIFGFLIGSLKDLFPGFHCNLVSAFIVFCVGAAVILLITRNDWLEKR